MYEYTVSMHTPSGYGLGPNVLSKREAKEAVHKDVVLLKWSTPRTTSMDLQFCTSAYRVTPSDVSLALHRHYIIILLLSMCVYCC